MKILNFRKIDKGSMKASFDIFIAEVNMTIKNLVYFHKNEKQWISFPSRKFQESNGEVKYSPYVQMEKDKKIAFDRILIDLITRGEYDIIKEKPTEEEPF